MFTAENPGCSGAAARLPKNPGSQKLTPPSSACDACGRSVPMTSAAAKPTPAVRRVVSRCFMTTPPPAFTARVPPTLLVAVRPEHGMARPHDRHDTPASNLRLACDIRTLHPRSIAREGMNSHWCDLSITQGLPGVDFTGPRRHMKAAGVKAMHPCGSTLRCAPGLQGASCT